MANISSKIFIDGRESYYWQIPQIGGYAVEVHFYNKVIPVSEVFKTPEAARVGAIRALKNCAI